MRHHLAQAESSRKIIEEAAEEEIVETSDHNNKVETPTTETIATVALMEIRNSETKIGTLREDLRVEASGEEITGTTMAVETKVEFF